MLPMNTTSPVKAAVSVAASAAAIMTTVSHSRRWDMGRYTGMRIAKFQNWLYEQNREWHFRDETLCVFWCVELPDAKSDYAVHLEYIDGTRRLYNAGRHQPPAPRTPSVAYYKQARLPEGWS
jgi:hypothetical protein